MLLDEPDHYIYIHTVIQHQFNAWSYIHMYIYVLQIDLFWLTKSQQSLSWFIEIFKELEEEQLALGLDPPLVNVHLYLTGK